MDVEADEGVEATSAPKDGSRAVRAGIDIRRSEEQVRHVDVYAPSHTCSPPRFNHASCPNTFDWCIFSNTDAESVGARLTTPYLYSP